MPSNQHSFIVHAALIFQPTQFVFCRLQPSHEQLMEQETEGFLSNRKINEKSTFNEALFSWLAKAVQP